MNVEWISIEDRLPPPDHEVPSISDTVLVSDENREVLTSFYSYGDKEWRIEFSPYSESLNVTHWMPLPEAPKDKKNLDGYYE